MTTPVTANTAASISTKPTTAETTTTDTSLKATMASPALSAVEDTIATLAQSLVGFADRSAPERARNQRMLNRIERLVDSIARLVEAISNYRAGTLPKHPEYVGDLPTPIEESKPYMPGVIIPETPDGSENCDACPPAGPSSDLEGGVSKPPSPNSSPFNLGSKLPATRGFLWKPVSDKNGKLAILLPKQYTGTIKRVRILNAQGTKVLATGKFSGVGNGNREHFRFTKPGDGFPDGAIVLIEMENGTSRHVKIKDTAKRTEQ